MTVRPEDVELPATVQVDVPLSAEAPELAAARQMRGDTEPPSRAALARGREALLASAEARVRRSQE